MPKFSDSPYFLLKDYLNELSRPYDIEEKEEDYQLLWDSVLFSNENYNEDDPEWDDGLGSVKWNSWYNKITYQMFNSYLRRPHDIIVYGGNFIELYIKDPDYGFRPIRLIPIFEDPIEQVYFRFEDYNYLQTVKAVDLNDYNEIFGPEWSCDLSDFKYYNSCPGEGFNSYFKDWKTGLKSTNIYNHIGKECYFRKDSPFYEWLKNSAYSFYIDKWEQEFNIRNYVNTDKSFIYFGQIYPSRLFAEDDDKEYFHIIFEGMKDFIRKSIPYHQQTPRLLEFLEIYFDRIYHEIYNLQKDTYSLYDPLEIDEKYLTYMSQRYNIDIDNNTLKIPEQREFVRDVIYLLKRKGTYNSLQILWKLISGSINKIDILERWHKSDLIGKINEKDYIDISYNDFYTRKLFTDIGEINKVANITSIDFNSIKIEANLPIKFNIGIIDDTFNTHIYKNEWVLKDRKYTKKITHNLNKKYPSVIIWNIISNEIETPANIISIISINSNNIEIELYQKIEAKIIIVDTDLRKMTTFLNKLDWNYNGIFYKDIIHNFNKRYPTITIWNTSTNEIDKLSNINSIDKNTIRIETNTPINANIEIIDNIFEEIIEVDDWKYKDNFYYKIIRHNLNPISWEFDHNLNNIYNIFTIYDTDNKIVYPYSIQVRENDMIIFFNIPVSGKCVLATADYNEYIDNESVWDINHNLNTEKIIFSVYDNDNNIVYPKEIEITDNNLKIYFKKNVSGRCVISMADYNEYIDNESVWDINHNLNTKHVIFSVYDNDNNIVYPKEIEITDNNLKIYFKKNVSGRCVILKPDMSTPYINIKQNDRQYFDRYLSVTTWNIKDLILSTTYKVDFNLDLEPLTVLEIEPKYLCDSLIYYFEVFRPTNRVFKRQFSITPFLDFSGEWFSLYDNVHYKNHCLTRYTMKEYHTEDSWIHLQMHSSKKWVIDHGLGTDKVLIQVLDLYMDQVIPKKIIYQNNTIILEFDHEISGACLLKKADWYKKNNNISENWLIKHDMDNKESLIQLKRFDKYIITEDDYTFRLNIPSNQWNKNVNDEYYKNITHNLDNKYPIVSMWNIENKKLEIPSEIISLNNNDIKIELDKNINADIIIFSDNEDVINININKDNWMFNGDYYYKIINHDLNINHLYAIMWNIDTEKIEKSAKLININPNNIAIYSSNPINAKIVLSLPKNNIVIDSWLLMDDIYYTDINYEMNNKYPIMNIWNLNTNEVEKYLNIECLNNNTLRVWSVNNDPIKINLDLVRFSDLIATEEIFEPSNIELINNDEILTDGHLSTAIGTIPDYIMYIETEKKKVWDIHHNLNKRGIMAQFYNDDNYLIYPKNYKVINNNLIRAEFNNPERGYAVLKDIGHYFLQSKLLPDIYGNFDLIFKAGTNENSMLKDGIMFTKDINTIYIIDDIYYISIYIPLGLYSYDIREMGIFEKSTGDMIIYTKCYPLYKHKDFEIEITYKIHKNNI